MSSNSMYYSVPDLPPLHLALDQELLVLPVDLAALALDLRTGDETTGNKI